MRSDPFVGRYLFHLHTTYTDGQLRVPDYFAFAQQERIDRLIFLEHIRAQPSYDLERFVTEVQEGAAASGIPAHLGFEAKLLPGGALDISEQHAERAEVIGIAEHGFPADLDLWRTSLRTALEEASVRYPGKQVVWVHPGLWLKKHRLIEQQDPAYRELLEIAQTLGIKVEWNLRYHLVPSYLRSSIRSERLVIGADAHRPSDLAMVMRVLPKAP